MKAKNGVDYLEPDVMSAYPCLHVHMNYGVQAVSLGTRYEVQGARTGGKDLKRAK